MRIERSQNLPHGEIHCFDHCRIDRVLLHQADSSFAFTSPFYFKAEALSFLFIFLLQIFPRHQRDMHRITPEHRQKRAILVSLDKSHCLRCQTIGQVFARRAVCETRVSVW
jgi:hypothetical protein